MDILTALDTVTEQLIRLFEESSLKEREEIIQAADLLLDKRAVLIAGLKPPFSSEEKEAGKRILERSQVLDRHLKHVKTEIQRDMKKLQIQRKSSEKYANPYQDVIGDGIFYDKKN